MKTELVSSRPGLLRALGPFTATAVVVGGIIGMDLGHEPLGFWAQRWVTIGVILGLAFVNVLGVRWGGLLQLLITTVKIGTLIGVAVLPFVVAALAGPKSTVPAPEASNLLPL